MTAELRMAMDGTSEMVEFKPLGEILLPRQNPMEDAIRVTTLRSSIIDGSVEVSTMVVIPPFPRVTPAPGEQTEPNEQK